MRAAGGGAVADSWDSEDAPPHWGPKSAGDWLRVLMRGLSVGTVTFGGLALLLAARLVERPVFGQARPWTPHITQFVCRAALWLLGIKVRVTGTPLDRPGAMVANHASWLDIFVLNAQTRLYFVSKSEVAGWPGIGWLARATGTVFIRRDRREAAKQTRLFQDRLLHGHRLLFFPEGTSTDGMQVLPFKTTLFQAFFADGLRDALSLQPVSVRYHAPAGADARLYGWWGDMDFGSHLLATLAWRKHGRVDVQFHAPVPVAEAADRKSLALQLEQDVRDGHAALAQGGGQV